MKSNLRCQKRRQGILQHCKLKANEGDAYYFRSTTPHCLEPCTKFTDWHFKSQIDTSSWPAGLKHADKTEFAFGLQGTTLSLNNELTV